MDSASADTSELYALGPVSDIGLRVAEHRSTEAKWFVLFVHGLSGTPEGTWEDFPRFLFESSDISIDVGSYEYKSGYRRLKGLGATLDHYRRQLQRIIVELHETEQYTHLFVAAHSMGGLLAAWAIKDLLNHKKFAQGPFTPVAGLFFIGTPLRGSRWVMRPLDRFNQDLQLLKPGGARQIELDGFFTDIIDVRNVAALSGDKRFIIPTYAAYGGEDRIVSFVSSTVGVPTLQTLPLTGNHRSIVKPENSHSSIVAWARKAMREVSNTRDSSGRVRRVSRQGLSSDSYTPEYGVLAELRTAHDEDGSIRKAYSDICVNGSFDLRVYDRQAAPATIRPLAEIRISVTDSTASDQTRTDSLHNWTISEAQSSPLVNGGLASVMASDEQIVLYRNRILDLQLDQRVWVARPKNEGDLIDTLTRWLAITVGMAQQRTYAPQTFETFTSSNLVGGSSEY